jgi:hypothetical protein
MQTKATTPLSAAAQPQSPDAEGAEWLLDVGSSVSLDSLPPPETKRWVMAFPACASPGFRTTARSTRTSADFGSRRPFVQNGRGRKQCGMNCRPVGKICRPFNSLFT